MATPVIVNTYKATGSGSASLNVPSVQSGDWIVAGFGNSYTAGVTNTAIDGTGTGTWADIGPKLGSPNSPDFQNFNMVTRYKIATGTGTYTVTATAANECLLIVYHLRSVNSIEDVSGAVTAQGTNSTARVASSVTTTTNDDLLIGFWGGVELTSGAQTYTPPSGMTERQDAASSANVAMMSASQVLTATGATGSRSATSSQSITHGGAQRLIAIKGGANVVPADTAMAASGAMGPAGERLLIPVENTANVGVSVRATWRVRDVRLSAVLSVPINVIARMSDQPPTLRARPTVSVYAYAWLHVPRRLTTIVGRLDSIQMFDQMGLIEYTTGSEPELKSEQATIADAHEPTIERVVYDRPIHNLRR